MKFRILSIAGAALFHSVVFSCELDEDLFLRFESDRYSSLAESSASFDLVLEYISAIESGEANENWNSEEIHLFQVYKNSYEYFTDEGSGFLDSQTLELPFSYIWHYPYQTEDECAAKKVAFAWTDYFRKATPYLAASARSDEVVAVILQQVANSFIWTRSDLNKLPEEQRLSLEITLEEMLDFLRSERDDFVDNPAWDYFVSVCLNE